MSTWNIYHKDGSKLTDVNREQITVHGLEYSDSWMGECFLTISFKHEVPISFQIGDYIVYRGERFELNYEPGKDKQARPDTYGEGFVYDSVKFNALQDELSRAEFLDVVLNDNELHYTALPKFPFYVQTLDDLLDRIQANLDEQIGKGLWKIYSRNMERSVQRGCLASDWLPMYGEGTSDNVIESMSITVDSQTCWQALALVNEKWNINFIVRGRNVYVGTTGIQAKHIFKYGLGNGLYEIVQNADSDQSVITRLRAYGSEKNLPSHYYADLGVKYVSNITKVVEASTYVELELDLDYIETYFKNKRKYVVSGESQEQYSGWVLQVTFDFQNIITGYVAQMHDSGKCRFHSELKGAQVDTGDEESKEKLDAFIAQVKAGKTKMYVTSGLNKKTVPSSMKEYAENLPNNMSINRLMLPGFPHVSLSDFYESLTDEEKKYVNPTGKQHRFSTDPHRPYIDSINIDQIGLRSASQFFDTDDKTNGIIEIYPTIEEMVVGGVRVDEIDEGIAPDDDGRFNDNENVKNVDIYLSKAVDFDINDLKDDDFSISMKDGMCGGRTFKVASSTKVDGRWRLTIERIKDDALELWFPYKDYPIRKGDHFVLTGITLPDSYVKAASLKLLKYAIALLEKNDYTRYVYQPKVDEIFMARQHDTAMADKTGAIKSLHDILKAGDLMDFRDDDLNISGTITIDQLNIKEQDGKIPTYEITLREDKEVGTIQKIQQQITSLENGNGGSGGGGGITLTQVKGQVATEGSKFFLSKLTDDTANGKITFIKGLIAKGLANLMMGATFGNSAKITELGEAFFRAIKSLDYDNAAEQGFSVEKEKNGKYHAFFTNLTIWGKAIFHELEIRKLSYSGGNIYLSGAGSKLIKVVPVKQSVSDGVTTWVETTEDDAECVGWKCYLLADDGTTATMNDWQEGDQARCQTMGEIVTGGTYTDASNKSYWRTIPNGGVSTQNEKIYGNKTETYLDEDGNEQTRKVQVELYDGQAFAWIVIGKHCGDIDGYDDEFGVGYNGSNPAPLETRDIPAEGDTIVLDGNRHRNKHGEYDKTDRQNVIILETTGEYAPRIACYANISEYKHTFTKSVNGSDKEVSLSVFETSPKGGTKINSSRFEWISDDGSTINIINYRGDWVSNNTYHKNDQVNHNNAVWVCVANSGVDVSKEPSEGSSDWKKVLSGGKGEKGDKGDDGLSGNGIVPAYVRSKDNPTPPTSTDKNNLDNGWSLAIPSVVDVKNVSYSDSSWMDYNDGSYTWKKSPTTANNSTSWCLVTFTTTQANQAVKFVIKSFSEPRYDYIFLSEIDASVVPPKPDYKGASRAVSGNGVELSMTDVVATAGTHTVYICYGKDASGDYNGDYGLFRIESMAGIPLWQSNGKEVFTREDGGTTKSKIESWSEPFRVTGENGEDAVSYTVTLTRGSNGITQGLYVGVTRYIGTACTTGTIIDFGMSCKAYTDGTLAEGLTDRLQTSDNYIDFAAFPKAKSFTVELLDKNGNKVATGNYSSGDDAISILVEDAPLVFDTDDSGTVPVNDTKTAKVKVMRGNTNVTNDCNQESSRDDLSSNCMCEVKKDKDNECISVSVQGRWIVKNDVIVEGVNQGKVSTTSGYAVAQFVYDSVVYFAQVPFSVNVAKFTGVVAFNNKQYESKFTEISTKFGQDLADAESRITQTAREISLSVSEKSVGRRNMLIGSACRKYGDGFVYMSGRYYDGYPLEQIEKNSGINGVNCIHCRTKQTGTSNFYLSGFRWHGVSPQGNIKLERGKNYVLSFYAKTHTPNDIYFMAEVLYQGSKIDTSRPDGYAGPTGHSTTFSASEVDKWELFTVKVSVPSDAPYEYVEINIFARARSYSFVGGYICKPMLEEGENYNGWTLSEQDYDYVGGNLLDNARTLDRSGTLITINDTVIQNGYGTDSACAKSLMKANATLSDYKEVLKWIFGSAYLVNGNDYIFSFVAKADVDDARVICYMWSGDIENSCDIFTECNGRTWDSRSDGNVVFILSRQWTRYWVHWRPKDGYATPKEVIIRHTGNNSTSASTVYVTQPKLEIGATMTEWTERKSDLVDKASLKAAGIEITSDQVTLYGNKVQVKTPKENPSDGYDEAAMFQNGKLNAQFINAGDIVAEGIKTQELEAQHLKVTGNSRLGIFEIHTAAEKDDRDQYSIGGDAIQYSGGYMFPDGKTEAFDAGSFLMYKPMFVRQGSPDNSAYMRLGYQFTEWDDCNIGGGNKNYLFVGAAARYVCSGETYSCSRTALPSYLKYYSEFKPAAYIYSVKTSPDDPAFAIKVVKPDGSSGERTAIQTNAAIRGVFAPNSTEFYKDQQIPNGIGVVYCSNNSDMTLTLPVNPVDGQTLIIIQGSNGRVYIIPPSNDVKIYCGGYTRDRNNKFYSGMTGQFNIFVYVSGAWQLQWMNYKP